jgi:hypothetical protein
MTYFKAELFNDGINNADIIIDMMPELDAFLRRYSRSHSDQARILKIEIEDATQENETVINGAADTELDGTTTAIAVSIKSSTANDKAGGSGCSLVCVIGINSSDQLRAYYVDPNGTDGNLVASFKRLLFAKPITGTPDGDITLYNDSTTYLTIAAGAFFSNGTKIYVPDGWGIQEIYFKGWNTEVQANEKAYIRTRFYNMYRRQDEKSEHIISFNDGEVVDKGQYPYVAKGNAAQTSYVDFSDQRSANDKGYRATIFLGLVKSAAL